MILYHVTRRDLLPSILTRGLDPECSRGILKSVWGVTASRVAWAIVHVLSKPHNRGVLASEFVVIRFDVSRKQLRRYRRAVWMTRPGTGCVPVTADQCISVASFGAVQS